ncbi:MAG: response regulator [Oscillospiraceae bacterium]|nr:response regulator [Oscillospiraceae bacterium]
MIKLFKNSIIFKTSLLLAVYIVVLIFAMTSINDYRITSVVKSVAELAGKPILEGMIDYIDGDKYENLVQTLDRTDPFFIETQEIFRNKKMETYVSYLYSMAINANGEHIFIFDGEDPNSEFYTPMGYVEDISEYDSAFLRVYETAEFQFTSVVQDLGEWGDMISAYAPILNSKNEVVGVVGVDFDGAYFLSIMNEMNFNTIFIMGISILIFVSYLYYVFRNIVKQNRTLKATSKILENTIEEKNELMHSKSIFFANMSHEIRTPLNVIIGMTALAENEDDNAEKNKLLVKTKVASNHLLNVINNVLEISKMDANKIIIDYSANDFYECIRDVVKIITFKVEEKSQNFKYEINNNIPKYMVFDNFRLTQILTNLLSNAVKFTPDHGTINFYVDSTSNEDGIYNIKFTVNDSGIGISKEQQEKLFDIFMQADDSTTKKYGGTGLGLFIAKFLTEEMGGSLYVESELNEGATFYAEFPVRQANEDEIKDSLIYDDMEIKDNDYSDKCLLLVEDIDINREIVIGLVKDLNIEVVTAENGKQAVEIYKKSPERFDIIFMDIMMPEMDGYEATRQIRKLDNEHSKKVPIIAMTANAYKEDIEKCLNAGMDTHIAKPYSDKDLFKILSYYLS